MTHRRILRTVPTTDSLSRDGQRAATLARAIQEAELLRAAYHAALAEVRRLTREVY